MRYAGMVTISGADTTYGNADNACHDRRAPHRYSFVTKFKRHPGQTAQ